MDALALMLWQQLPPTSPDAALRELETACARAARERCQLLLLPEMWWPGYDPARMAAGLALPPAAPLLQAAAALALRHRLALALPHLALHEGGLRNRLTVFDSQGRVALRYDKVHLCQFDGGYEHALDAGDAFPVAEVACGDASVRLGAMICYDREFPESARSLMRQDAELILVPNACPMLHDAELGDARWQQLRGRALESRAAVALCNLPAPSEDGGSGLIDARGRVLAQADARPQALRAVLDLAALRRWRAEQDEVWGQGALRLASYFSPPRPAGEKIV